MPQYQISVPGQGTFRVDSPTELTDLQAWQAVQNQLSQAAPAKKEGFGAAFGKGIESILSPTRTAFGAVTGSAEEAALAGLKRSEASPYADQVSLDKVKAAYERGLLPAAGEVLRQIPLAITEQAPNIAATLGSARLGAMAGAGLGSVVPGLGTAVGTIGGGILGAVAPSLLQQFGGNIQRQAQEQLAAKQPVDISRTAAAAAAGPQAALDVAATFIPMGRTVAGAVLGPQVKQLLEKGAKEGAEKLARESLPTVLAKGAGISIATEAPTEAIQSMLERAQAGLPLLSDDALKEYGEAAYQAALIAPIGSAARVGERSAAKAQTRGPENRPGETDRQAAERIQAEILAMKEAAKPPVAPSSLILDTNNLYTLMAQPNGWSLVEKYKQRLMALPEQTPEVKQAIEAAAFIQNRADIEKAQRRTTKPVPEEIVQPKGPDAGETVTTPSGTSNEVAGKPGEGAPTEGAGAPVPGGVVPAVADAGQPATGEGAKPPSVAPEVVTVPTTTKGAVEQHAVKGLPIIEAPLGQLTISKDVPQFKSEADQRGVVKPLEGKFERTGVAPIQLWRRTDGRLEVISGRHRFDLAQRSGETTIPAQIHDESAGFDAVKAATLDAELNIRDEQGEVKDYVVYFERSGISEADAKARGLLARPVGQRGWAIASQGSPDLIAAHRAGIVPDDAAAGIATIAPKDSRLQAVGLKAVRDNKSTPAVLNTMQAVKALAAERGTPQEEAGDLFGFDDSAIKEAEEMARIATDKQREVSKRLSAIDGAAKNPAVAKAEGIDIKDEAALNKRIQELRQLRAAWNNWSSNPALVKEIKDEITKPATPQAAPPVEPPAAEPKKSLVEMRKRYEAGRAAPAVQTQPEAKPPEQTELDKEIEAKIDELGRVLSRIMGKFGLKDVALKLVEDMKAEGEYAQSVVRLALDAASPVQALRHESIHALKELGFFSPQQWAVLEKQAKSKWIDQYLKNVNINKEPLGDGEKSRYDAYSDLFKSQGLSDAALEEAIIEEAIADAFGDFDVNKAPPGLMQAILNRLRNFFDAVKTAFGGEVTAEQVFRKVEKGELKAEAAPATKEEAKPSLRKPGEPVTRENVLGAMERAQEAQPYMNCQLCVQMATGVTKLRDLPKVKEAKIGDVYTFGETKDMASHYAIEVGNGDVAEVEQWGEKVRVIPLSEVVDEYGDPSAIRRPPETAYSAKVRPSLRAPKTEAFKKWSGGAPVVGLRQDHVFVSGKPVVVEALHGTTNADIAEFKKSQANIESDFGAGFYASNTPADVAINYANVEGADLTRRIETLAERIADNEEFEGDMDAAMDEARKRLSQGAPNTMKLYMLFKNPAVLGGKGETFFDYTQSYNEETDEYGEPTGSLVDFVNQLDEIGEGLDISMWDVERAKQDLIEAGRDNEGLKFSELAQIVKDRFSDTYDLDGGSTANGEVLRQALEGMGFDGVIDTNAYAKFGPRMIRGAYSMIKTEGMAGLDKDTVHFVAFKPTQIKSATGNIGTFDATSPDIRYSLRDAAKIDLDRSLNDKRISPRLPTAVKAKEDAMGEVRLQPDLDTFKRDDVAFRHNIALMSKYPNFSHIKGTPAQRAEQMIEHMKGNLLWLFNSWDAKLRDRSKLWYVGGNRIAHRWADKYGIPAEQAAGIIAALSPQKDWFQNVSLAERTLDALVFNADTTWSPEMTRVFKDRAWAKKFPLSKYQGTTLKDMYRPGDAKSLVDMSVWIRAWDEANNVQAARVITPEGTFTNEMAAGKTGKPVAMRAQSFAAMVKTLQVLQQSDLQVISDLIGKNHKVRSFYNNIIAPYSGDDVTIDTHAVAAALLRPLGSSDLEVYHNFGSAKPAKKDKEGNILIPASAGTKNSAVTGLYGTYAMYAEAYRRAAEDAGVLPRELQSITWEAIRGLFRPEQKQAKLKNQTNVLWNKVGKGEINGQSARDEISKLVSGIEDPAWAKSPAGANESRTDSSYSDELSGVGVPGREPAGVPSGTGERVAGAVPKLSLRVVLPQSANNRIIQTTSARQEKGFVERLMEAISPSSYSDFRAQALNRYNQLGVYDKIRAKKMGGAYLLANASAESAALLSDLGAGLTASALGVHDRMGGIPVYRNGITIISNKNGTIKGPTAIFAPLAGHPRHYQDYQYWAAVKRGLRFMYVIDPKTGKPIEKLFDPNVDPIEAEKVRKAFLKKGIDFEAIQKEWIKYNDGLIEYMVDTGVLAKERADLYRKHADYLPFYRQMDGKETVGPKIFQSISNVKPPKKLKGGEAPLDDFLENIVRNTQSAIQAGVKNIAAQRAAKVAVDINMAKRLKYKASTSSTFDVLENGEVVTYDSQDPLFINAIKSLGIPDLPFIGLLSGPANLLRNLVTKDPGFMLANLMRDSMSSWVTSGVKMTPMVNTFNNFGAALAGKDPAFQALMNAGILGGYEFSQNVEQSGREFGKALRKQAKIKATGMQGVLEMGTKPFTSLWEALEKGTTASDAATRMEVYKKTLAETGNEAEALYRALEVMNFNRKGSSAVVRILTAAVPFLNARVQGLDVLYRASFGEMNAQNAAEIQKRFFVRGATIAALSAAYWLLTHDDEEYKKQEQETRDNYWLIPSLGVKIPIPFEIGVAFKVIPERILGYAFGSDTGEDFLKSMARQLTSTLAFNPIPQAAMPIVETMTNFSFFTMRPIVGQGLEGLQPAYQVGPGTSRLAQGLGEMTKGMAKELQVSPAKIDQLISGYTGTMGMYLVNLMDAIYDMNADSPKPSRRFEQMPFIRRFAVDPEARGTVTAYYELKNSVDAIVRTSNMLERTMNYEELPGYLSDNMTMLASKDYILDLEKTMKEFREMKIMIRSAQMSAEAKGDAVAAIDQMENQLTANIQYIKKIAKGG